MRVAVDVALTTGRKRVVVSLGDQDVAHALANDTIEGRAIWRVCQYLAETGQDVDPTAVPKYAVASIDPIYQAEREAQIAAMAAHRESLPAEFRSES